MTKKVLLLSALFSILVTKTLAQVTEFQMKDYRYRTNGFKALGLRTMGNSVASNKDSSSFSFSLNPGTNYNQQHSTDKSQFNFSNWTALGINKLSNTESPMSFNVGTRFGWSYRWYKNNYFVETGSNSGVGIGKSPSNESDKTLYNASLNPTGSIGTGRLEFVSHAQMALFILENLKDAGKIKGTVSKEMAYKFTELITELYNSRVFDFRKRRNYEVAKIDSFLTKNKITSTCDITVYNIIADNWNYAIQPAALEANYFYSGTLEVRDANALSDRINQFGIFNQSSRYAGKRTTFKVVLPSQITNGSNDALNGYIVQFASVSDSTIKDQAFTIMGVQSSLTWEQHRPLSLKKQDIISVRLATGNNWQNTRTIFVADKADSNYKTQVMGYSFAVDYMYSYFPNSRTVLSSSSTLMYSNSDQVINYLAVGGVSGGKQIVLSSFLSIQYFINMRSRISGYANFSLLPVNTGYGGKGVTFDFSLSYINYLF